MHPKALAVLGQAGSACQNIDSDILSTAIAVFKEDGEWGHFNADWIKEAMTAHEIRTSGQTAAYEEHLFNEMWGCEKETLSDDEESGQTNGDQRDQNGRADSCSTTASYAKGDDRGVYTNLSASSSDELHPYPNQYGPNGLNYETIKACNTTDAQNRPCSPISHSPGPGIIS